ncbi:MAG: LLM class F420-dependent oxidoreductase [Alphaproteobacteria bacterium]|nr:LLM class F420-dependent oxidoreductase [Alphaproteobacteria bacterium]
MQYGISMFPTDYSITPADLAIAMEARGFESFWAPEHSHIPVSRKSPWPGGPELPKPYYDVMDPFVALATAAAVTKKLKLATGICLVIQRDPIQTAKEICTLDTLSGGRFLFGVGAGWNAEEMADHGTKFSERMDVMRERIDAIKLICSKSKPEYHGKHVNFEPFMTWPKSVQKPHPPVIVGGGYPHGAKRAAEYGDGWMPITGRDDVISCIPKFRQMLAERDRDPDTVEITVFGVMPDAEKIKPFRDAGVKRVVFGVPSEGAEAIIPRLDKMVEIMQQAK